jgi:hypothetical protein
MGATEDFPKIQILKLYDDITVTFDLARYFKGTGSSALLILSG